MSQLYRLSVGRPGDDKMTEWFFDEHMHYLRAAAEARAANCVVVSPPHDIVTDLHEFRNWLERKEP